LKKYFRRLFIAFSDVTLKAYAEIYPKNPFIKMIDRAMKKYLYIK